MKLYTTIRRLILSGILLVGNAVNAQIFVMQNAQTIEIDACENPSGIIYDDGGPTADYANNFDGYIIIRASAGLTINLSGTYFTESCCDRLTIQDGTTTLVDEVGGSDSVNVSSTTGIGSRLSQYYLVRNKYILINKNFKGLNKIIAYCFNTVQMLYRCLKGELLFCCYKKGYSAFLKNETGRRMDVI